jgi:hypothetical protein
MYRQNTDAQLVPEIAGSCPVLLASILLTAPARAVRSSVSRTTTEGRKSVKLARGPRGYVALTLAMMAMLCAGPAAAQDTAYLADTVSYHNKGAYKACFTVHWTDVNGRNYDGKGKKCAQTTSRQRWDLGKVVDTNGRSIKDFSEVWIIISIVGGDTKTCRKDNKKIFYSTVGGTVKYKSSGTTLNDNRCKIDSLPSVSMPYDEFVQYYIEPSKDQ